MEEIYSSTFWKIAEKTPDRHYSLDSWVMLSHHLARVLDNVKLFFDEEVKNGFYSHVKIFLELYNLNLSIYKELLFATALLHDIWKPSEDKLEEIKHPITWKKVKVRHPVEWVRIAIEIYGEEARFSKEEQGMLFNLIDEHDTPYSWYRQFEKNGVIPKYKSWRKLDKKISSNDDSKIGIILLAIFKLADIDWHDDISDVIWFIENLNKEYLKEDSIEFPVPKLSDIK